MALFIFTEYRLKWINRTPCNVATRNNRNTAITDHNPTLLLNHKDSGSSRLQSLSPRSLGCREPKANTTVPGCREYSFKLLRTRLPGAYTLRLKFNITVIRPCIFIVVVTAFSRL